jgi:nicotinate-nucleotide adenylyltransferase
MGTSNTVRPLVFYGGTFDPVHCGHLAVAQAARDALPAEVRLVPAADPPHKDATHADAAPRAEMLELAIDGAPGLCVDRRELARPGPSFSVDTLRELRAESGPARPLAWLVGGDSVLQLHTWHRWRELFALAHVLAVPRPGAPLDPEMLARLAPEVHAEVAPRWRAPGELSSSPAGGFAVLAPPALREESSSELRRRIAAGEPWQAWVPAPVAAFIEARGLYRARP